FEEMKRTLDAGGELELELNSELASEIVRAVETDEAREVYGNVRNDGLIDGLPDDACVEVPCLADENGVRPTRIGAIPPQCLALNRSFVNVAELTVPAPLDKSGAPVYGA